MSNIRPITRELAAWLAGVRREALPPQVRHQARRVLLDYVAATLAGSRSSSARLVHDYLLEYESPGQCQVLGADLRLSPAQAALANGTAAHGLEIDDGYTPGAYHPGAPVISAALAAGEHHGSSIEELLTAIALGFELSCRLAGAGHPVTWRRGLHNTPLAGVFGAAVAVSSLLRANEEQFLNSLGLAGSHAGGLFEFLGKGAEVKRLHAGKAARDGVICAELAQRGLTGPDTVLEGNSGYAHAFVDDQLDTGHLMDGLGVTWRMLRTYVKPYPCCRHLHGPIDAILELAETHSLDPDTIKSVEIGTYPAAVKHGFARINGFLDAQMSIPYAVAVTILHGAPTLEHFETATRADPRVARLLRLVNVHEAEECTRDYPAMRPARVRVATANGVVETRIDQPWGEPDRPVDDTALTEKVHRLNDAFFGTQAVTTVVEAVWNSDDAHELFDALAAVSTKHTVSA